MATAPHSPPRQFPTSGFVSMDVGRVIQEEGLPLYVPEDYYPASLGEVIRSRYQIVSKLGFGVNSTVWLCRDLWEHQYLTLKIRVRNREDASGRDPHADREITINEHLKRGPTTHPGCCTVRRVLDSFEVTSPHGTHKCILYQPLGMSLSQLQDLLEGGRLVTPLTQKTIQLILLALEYLHQCHVVHTDISPNNVLLSIDDPSVLSEIEQGELERPIARKVLRDRTIYNSRLLPLYPGQPILCDLGEARAGPQKHRGDIMPDKYRAPEVILGMEWDSKVDIWAMGTLMWSCLEGSQLFAAKKDGILDDEQHLAEMVSLLGPPPPEFLKRSEKCSLYWDSQGIWKGSTPIPDQSFESREQWLQGEDRALFFRCLRRMLCWMPEERSSAEELTYDEFMMQHFGDQSPEEIIETPT